MEIEEKTGKNIIQAENLSVFYGEKAALKDLNITVRKARVTAVVGPSGCGKSSFLSACNRMTDFIPAARVKGKILIQGEDIHRKRTDTIQLRRRVGMIFQKSTPFQMSILRNITLPLQEHGMKEKAEREETAIQALKSVHLWDEVKNRLSENAESLSGGQQQRLCIARALALKPEILLMDEPCSALDPLSSGKIEDLIIRLQERVSIVIVTHNLAQARRIADDVALFWFQDNAGKLIETAPVRQFFENPVHPLTQSYISGMRG